MQTVLTSLTSKIYMEQPVCGQRSLEIAKPASPYYPKNSCRVMQIQGEYLYWMPAACVVVGLVMMRIIMMIIMRMIITTLFTVFKSFAMLSNRNTNRKPNTCNFNDNHLIVCK